MCCKMSTYFVLGRTMSRVERDLLVDSVLREILQVWLRSLLP